jgi:UrcA family protein
MFQSTAFRYVNAIVLTGLTLGAFAWLPASADTSLDGSRTKSISLQGIDLSTVEGQQVARERVHQMARQLCTQVSDDLDLSHRANFLACVDSAMAAANRRIAALVARDATTRLAHNDVK